MDLFWICFVPLFVAVDAIGLLPLFVALTEGIDEARLQRIVFQSVAVAAGFALLFLGVGPSLLRALGITVADFMVAGGLLLLVISLGDMLSADKRQRHVDPESLGAVPIGIPLITGPAVLTTAMLLGDSHGKLMTAAALVTNMALAGIVLAFARPITRKLGRTGTKAISKIASLFLIAIAVMLIRKGIFIMVGQ